MKGGYKMLLKKTIICFLVIAFCLLTRGVLFGASPEDMEMEKQQYNQDLNRIASFRKSLVPGPTNDLKDIEKLADEIQSKWSQRNKEYYAHLMLEICGPLSSGRFNDDRQFTLARKYALLILEEPNEISLETELKLIRHVMSDMATLRAPKGQEWVQQRRKDVEIRLHAWKRLTDAIDWSWDPNDVPLINVPLPVGVGGEAGGEAKHIKDPKLRAEYEAAIEKNRQKAERYNKQYRLRKWLKRFPKRAERYIIQAYSRPPYNLEELKQFLDTYIADAKTRSRIINAVTKNIEKQTTEMRKEPKE